VVLHHTEAGTAFRMIEMLCEKFHRGCGLRLRKSFVPKQCLRLKRESGSRERSTDGRVILTACVTRRQTQSPRLTEVGSRQWSTQGTNGQTLN
jgi:hypothetical protein